MRLSGTIDPKANSHRSADQHTVDQLEAPGIPSVSAFALIKIAIDGSHGSPHHLGQAAEMIRNIGQTKRPIACMNRSELGSGPRSIHTNDMNGNRSRGDDLIGVGQAGLQLRQRCLNGLATTSENPGDLNE